MKTTLLSNIFSDNTLLCNVLDQFVVGVFLKALFHGLIPEVSSNPKTLNEKRTVDNE